MAVVYRDLKPFGCPKCGCRRVNKTRNIYVSIEYDVAGKVLDTEEREREIFELGNCAACNTEFNPETWKVQVV